MINLLKNELIKVFKKKTIYIMFSIIIVFVLGISLIYKYQTSSYNQFSYYTNEGYRENLKNDLKNLNVNSDADRTTYISVKTQLDISDLYIKYGTEDWQASIINSKIEPLIYSLNDIKYSNIQDFNDIEIEYNKYIERLDKNDWKSFAKDELESLNAQKKELEKSKLEAVDKELLKELEAQIYGINVDIEALNIRLDNDISYKQGYLNSALEEYTNSKKDIYNYQGKDLEYNEKLTYDNLMADMEKSKYIIDTKQDIEDSNTSRYWILDIYNQYGMFIFITIIIITATIVSEEFSKGTIKLLLIKPYNRYKILASKLITSFIVMIIVIAFLVITTTVITGCIFSFESLKIPAVEYNFNTNSLETMSIFKYVVIETLYQLPNYLFILVLTFAISTIITNSGIAIAMSLVFQMFYQIINMIAIQYNIKLMKYFITLNLDFTQYKFGAKPQFEYINFTHSIIVYIIYILALLIPTFIVFKKKNIKNI